jgi:hypothetical protein
MASLGVQIKGSILIPARDNKHVCFLITDWDEWHKLKLLLDITAAQITRRPSAPKLPYAFAAIPKDDYQLSARRECEVRVWAKATKKQVEATTASTALDANFFLSARTYNFTTPQNGDRMCGVVLKLHKFDLI